MGMERRERISGTALIGHMDITKEGVESGEGGGDGWGGGGLSGRACRQLYLNNKIFLKKRE